MSRHSALLPIIAHARAGAPDHAWRLFQEGGLEAIDDDPAVLSVRGRLLKDRALRAKAAGGRRDGFRKAAEAYARAAALGGQTYPLINAASLALLAGERAIAQERAALVLKQLDAGGDQETPYYAAATRAEALLALGRLEPAKAALAEAVAAAPRAWEDHASTLRQFALILDALGQETAWLDALRPPKALHFAGHMGAAPDDRAFAAKVRETLAREGVGFGYGALAAGSDIVIAEALLERGAELHLLLPGGVEAFRAISVDPFGAGWPARFDAVLGAADRVRAIAAPAAAPHRLGVRLAEQAAMGLAAIQAGALATEPLQLLVVDRAGSTEPHFASWRAAGRRQLILTEPRRAGAPKQPVRRDGDGYRLTAMLAIEPAGADDSSDPDRLVEDVLPRLAKAVGSGPAPLSPPRWTGRSLAAAYATPAQAVQAALALRRAMGDPEDVRTGGHYGIVRWAADPFGGAELLIGSQADVAADVLRSIPPGAIHVTEDLAAAAQADARSGEFSTACVGEIPAPDQPDGMPIYAVE